MNDLQQNIRTHLNQLKAQGLHRQRYLINDDLIHFCNNDYLSLAKDPRIKQAYQKGFDKYPAGSGGSAVICGYHSIHKELEDTLCQVLNTDAALLFSSGYAANLSLVLALTKMQAHLLLDKGLHASIYDGVRMANTTYSRYLHNNVQDLTRHLAKILPNPLVITEGIFSMSGQLAILDQILPATQRFNASCIVDEAHSFGVIGEHGLGAVSHFSFTQKEVPLRILPFGKAFAAQGAMILGQGEWIDALLQFARPHTYSTSISPALAYGLLETFKILYESSDRRQKLQDLVTYFRSAISNSPLNWEDSYTPIQQLQLGCPKKAIHYADVLENQGIFCKAIRPPTVAKNLSGLRVVLNYHHEPEDIDLLFQKLESIHEHLSKH